MFSRSAAEPHAMYGGPHAGGGHAPMPSQGSYYDPNYGGGAYGQQGVPLRQGGADEAPTHTGTVGDAAAICGVGQGVGPTNEELTACGVGCGEGGSPDMNFVGNGQGEYIQQTTYRYIGKGGDFCEETNVGRRWYTCCVGSSCCVGTLVIVALCYLSRPLDVPALAPTDCAVDFDSWQTSWDQEKQTYCCQTLSQGCSPSSGSSASPPSQPNGVPKAAKPQPWAASASQAPPQAPPQAAWKPPGGQPSTVNAAVQPQQPGMPQTPPGGVPPNFLAVGQPMAQPGGWNPMPATGGCTAAAVGGCAAGPPQGTQQQPQGPLNSGPLQGPPQGQPMGHPNAQHPPQMLPPPQMVPPFGQPPANAFGQPPVRPAVGGVPAQNGALPPVSSIGNQQALPVAKPFVLATTAKPFVFDCDAGYDNFQQAWSPAKKSYCCHEQGRACTPAMAAGHGAATGSSSTSSTRLVSIASTTSAPFDCEAGLDNFLEEWSIMKKNWCCQMEAKGCQAPSR